MSGVLNDLRYAVRILVRNPGFTVVCLLTLAIGIGANSAIFSFVDSALLRPLPYPDADRIVRVLEKPPLGERNGISTLNFLDWRNENTVFDYMAAQTGGDLTLTGRGDPVQLRGGRVSARFFDIFGIHAALGRTFAPDEDALGKDHVAVLSHALWVSQFGGDRNLVGQTIRLDGEPYLVIGVLPEGSAFDRAYNQIWTPLAFLPENMTRNFHWMVSFAKLKPGVSVEQARNQMNVIGSRIAQEFPDSNKGWGVVVERYADVIVEENLRKSLYVLMAAVGTMLLIGCANLANLMLAQGAAREGEVAVRSALGAERTHLIRQFLTQSLLLALVGGGFGVALGYWVMAALKAALPPFSFAREVNITMDTRVLLFTIILSLLTGGLFGLFPAIGLTKMDLVANLKEGMRGKSAGMRKTLRASLVVAEVALAFLLLSGAGLLIRSFFRMQQADLGFDSTNVLTGQLAFSEKRYPDPVELNSHVRQILAGIRALPGIQAVAFTSALPMEGWGYGMPFQIAGRPLVDRAQREGCFFKIISPSYFLSLGLHLKKGRVLTDRDVAGSPAVTVINETFARKYFQTDDPIGQHILIQRIIPGKRQLGPEVAWEVVGVIADERVTNLDNKRPDPGVYVTSEQSPVYFGGLVVRGAIDPLQLGKAMQQAVHNVDKDQPLTDVKTLEQIKTESMGSDRLRSLLLEVFAGIAVLLAAIGIYGVISYSVTQRTGEIGVRAALGASRSTILLLILKDGFWMIGAGLMLGFAGGLALTRLVSLYGISAGDPLTLITVAGLLGFVGLTASYIPASRAAGIDPAIALRQQ